MYNAMTTTTSQRQVHNTEQHIEFIANVQNVCIWLWYTY